MFFPSFLLAAFVQASSAMIQSSGKVSCDVIFGRSTGLGQCVRDSSRAASRVERSPESVFPIPGRVWIASEGVSTSPTLAMHEAAASMVMVESKNVKQKQH